MLSRKALRIALDGRPALWPRTGIGTITHAVLEEIARFDASNQYFAYIDHNPDELSRRYPGLTCAGGGSPNKMLWANTWLPRQLRNDRIDVFITFLDKEVPLLPTQARIVSMIHDLIPMRFPQIVFRNAAHRVYYNAVIRVSARRCDLLLTNSEFSRTDIVETLHVPPKKVRTLPLGVRVPHSADSVALRDVLTRHKLSQPFALALGSTDPRKNNRRVIEATRLLAGKFPALQLAIAGANWRGVQFESEWLDSRVRLLGQVPDGDLQVLLQSAEALVFPSLFEGFGFPVIEAMAHGTPVITSRRGALPEVAGDAALYADPESAADIAAQIERVLSDSELAESMRRKGRERARAFRWDSTCAEILRICEQLVSPQSSSLQAVTE